MRPSADDTGGFWKKWPIWQAVRRRGTTWGWDEPRTCTKTVGGRDAAGVLDSAVNVPRRGLSLFRRRHRRGLGGIVVLRIATDPLRQRHAQRRQRLPQIV